MLFTERDVIRMTVVQMRWRYKHVFDSYGSGKKRQVHGVVAAGIFHTTTIELN